MRNSRPSRIICWIYTGKEAWIFWAKYANYRQEVLSTLAEFQGTWDGNLGVIHKEKHHIELTAPELCPINSTLYRGGPKAHDFKKAEMDKTLCMNVIDPAKTKWASPMVFALMNDGFLQFRIHYKKLNAVTVKETKQSCEWTNVSTGKVNNASSQRSAIPKIDDRDKDKTRFISHHGLYRLSIMPLGLKDSTDHVPKHQGHDNIDRQVTACARIP